MPDNDLSSISQFIVYDLFIQKEKSTYETLNMLQQSRNSFYGYIWSPADKQSLNKELAKHVGSLNMWGNLDSVDL